MEPTGKLINKLRKITGAGVIDCKAALKNTSSIEEAAKYVVKNVREYHEKSVQIYS